jgi:hypoxanthine-guanine phosphoribosyltransferase
MTVSYLQKPVPTVATSAELARKLRTGPIRSILDRILRSAAEATGLPCVILGIRYGDFGEFIATYGIPLSQYRDKVPAKTFPPKNFAREFEISDLSNFTEFASLSSSPIAHKWRYAANVPVRLQSSLSDDGVLALGCADYKVREKDGRILSILRNYADTISDLIWMSEQAEQAVSTIDPIGLIKAVLLAGLSRLNMQICVLDPKLNVIGYSKPFDERVHELGGDPIQAGRPLSGFWMTPELQQAIRNSLDSELPRQWLAVEDPAGARQLADIYPISFAELGTFGVLALHQGEHAIAALADITRQNEVGEPAAGATTWGNDGAGPVSRFLLETLVHSRRLNRSGQTSFIGLRKWRSPIKQYQISALKALKQEIPAGFVAAVADELAEAIRSVHGDVNQCIVVPVPCGSSGPDCLSCQLATALARRLQLPMVQAFKHIDLPQGSSHPRRNIKRQPMALVEEIDQPVILVDDVATSGSHIDEAASLLRKRSSQVWPVVWISS